ncbi:MAG: hypothetical protein PHI12_11155, partial [Dehalococcoidales bacterium]|nr:hypothetical protein [Dehalococcoidales bacterium]
MSTIMVQKYVECQLCTPPETIEPRAKFFHVKHHHPEHVEDYEEIKDEIFVEVEPPVDEEEEMPKEPEGKPEPIKVTDKTRRQQRPLYDPAIDDEERRIPHEPPRIEVGQPLAENDLYEGTTIEYQGRKYTPEDLIFAYGLTGVKALMKEELKVALQETPKEPGSKVMSFILSQFDRHPQYSQMPQALFDLLMKVAKLEPFIAQEVVTR